MRLKDYLTEKILSWNKDKMIKIGHRGREAVLYSDGRISSLGVSYYMLLEIDQTVSDMDCDDIIRAFSQDKLFKLDFTDKFEDIVKAGFKDIKEINKPMKGILQVVFK